ncbi:periplasmic heavy metal sensor [Roseobacteraceae bacterium S113]
MADLQTDPPKTRVPVWVKIALVSSLALNLIVAGLVIGAVSQGGPGKGPGMGRDGGATPFARALDKDDRRAVGREIRRSLRDGAGGAQMEARRQGQSEALALLRAEEFDSDAFATVMARQADFTKTLAQTGSSVLSRHLGQMSYEERLDYADRVEEQLKKRRKPRP